MFQSAQLHVDDQLLKVQEHSLIGISYEKAIELIRSCRGAVELTVSQSTGSAPSAEAANQNSSSSQVTDSSVVAENQVQSQTIPKVPVTSSETNQNETSRAPRDSISTANQLPAVSEAATAAVATTAESSQGKMYFKCAM